MKEIVTTKEIAERLGVKHRTVYQWRFRGIFPEPDVKARPPLWYWSTIQRWTESTGRGKA